MTAEQVLVTYSAINEFSGKILHILVIQCPAHSAGLQQYGSVVEESKG